MPEDKKKKKFGPVKSGKLKGDADRAAENLLGSKGKHISDKLYTKMLDDPNTDDRQMNQGRN